MRHSLSTADIIIFHQKAIIFILSGNKDKNYILKCNLRFLTVIEFLKVLISVIAILMMSAKLPTPGLLRITVFWNKDYTFILQFYDIIKNYHVTRIILFTWSCDQSLVTSISTIGIIRITDLWVLVWVWFW